MVPDLPVLLLDVVPGLDALPRQSAPDEVDEDVADALEVVATALGLAEVAVDAHVPEDKGAATFHRRTSKCVSILLLLSHLIKGVCRNREY